MPYRIRKKRGHDCYKVINVQTNRVMSECTTKEQAIKQVFLLEELDEQIETKDNTKKIIKVKKDSK